jgi:hypothetical protein
MKVKDIIIAESKKGTLRSDLKSTLNRSNKFATANDRFYDLNRVMMAAASTNGIDVPEMDSESWIGKSNLAMPFTKEEDAMIKKACKAAKTNITNIVNTPSHEPKDTDNKSPVIGYKGPKRKS